MLPRQQHVLNALAMCAAACDQCAALGLQDSPAAYHLRSFRLSRDCADLCRLAATFVAREAEHSPHLLRECAELCRDCANECTQFDTAQHRACTEACRRGEDACRTAFV
ncbi:four-helix bundle copper-binding protein [Hymenobacter metallilatus]|uniref:Four-helix bundle copper-binding protein n=1 Tax=Hymenobacter metallilatus TaxID=2493666 RepID=A0A428JJS5_9BACT|nr:four-helix bundle copper-binding protein [Hymenobacter metallilatus]RSK33106.1 four-helix bundle copper-binding protein [Hymenobacter metallilatus]